MRTLPRLAAAAGAAVVLSFSLTACGGAPTDASTEDFCNALTSGEDDVDKYIDKLEEVGTPEEIDGEAREGFEILLDKAKDLEDIESDEAAREELGEDDYAKVETFTTEAGELCADEVTSDSSS